MNGKRLYVHFLFVFVKPASAYVCYDYDISYVSAARNRSSLLFSLVGKEKGVLHYIKITDNV